jgi:RNA polymerase sigma-70 factor, ECF subfamily
VPPPGATRSRFALYTTSCLDRLRRKIGVIPSQRPDVTALLLAWRAGDEDALGRIVPLVQEELRQIARRCLRNERAHHSLQATALVNEAYLRLIDARRVDWQNRTHFLAMSARLMRRVLVDYARTKGADKRGGDMVRVSLSEAADRADDIGEDVVALSDALETLENIDARKGRIVELRFFAGLTVEETAAVMEISPQTVAREWTFAKAWLRRELKHR